MHSLALVSGCFRPDSFLQHGFLQHFVLAVRICPRNLELRFRRWRCVQLSQILEKEKNETLGDESNHEGWFV